MRCVAMCDPLPPKRWPQTRASIYYRPVFDLRDYVSQSVTVRCSVILCVAVRCNVLQCVAVCCSVRLERLRVAECCSALQCDILCCSALQCNTLQHIATHCNTQCDTTTHCNTQQHVFSQVERCNALQHTISYIVCCSVLQCSTWETTCCCVLQCVAVSYCVLQCVAMRCSVLQCVAVFNLRDYMSQSVAVRCSVWLRVAVCRNVLQCVSRCQCCGMIYHVICRFRSEEWELRLAHDRNRPDQTSAFTTGPRWFETSS